MKLGTSFYLHLKVKLISNWIDKDLAMQGLLANPGLVFRLTQFWISSTEVSVLSRNSGLHFCIPAEMHQRQISLSATRSFTALTLQKKVNISTHYGSTYF